MHILLPWNLNPFQNIFVGTYYPAISCYRSTVTANFGPKFEFEVKDLNFKPTQTSEYLEKKFPKKKIETFIGATVDLSNIPGLNLEELEEFQTIVAKPLVKCPACNRRG